MAMVIAPGAAGPWAPFVSATIAALSECFGRETFSRAYGLVNLVNLPFAVVSVPAAAMVYAHTGSYAGAIVGQVAFLALGSVLVLFARRGRRA